MHASEQKPHISFLKRGVKNLVFISTTTLLGSQVWMGWEFVFYFTRERTLQAVIWVPGCKARQTDRLEHYPPNPSWSLTQCFSHFFSGEYETRSWELFSFLIGKLSYQRYENKEVVITPTELKWDLPKNWKPVGPSMSLMSGKVYQTFTHKNTSIFICPNLYKYSLDGRGLWPQSFLLI